MNTGSKVASSPRVMSIKFSTNIRANFYENFIVSNIAIITLKIHIEKNFFITCIHESGEQILKDGFSIFYSISEICFYKCKGQKICVFVKIRHLKTRQAE